MGAVLAHGSFFCYLICMKKILITAFEPFGGERINPAQAVLERLPEAISGAVLYRSVLPVSYRKSAALLLEQIERVRPDAVVMLGQAGGRAKITPERIAVNLDHCEACDNDGEQRIDSVIHPEGPAAYFSTLPVHAMLQEMRKYEVGCAMSASAGAFVCNHVSYEALHYISRMGYGIPAGFIHLPYLPEQAEGKPGAASMPLSAMVHVVQAALAAVADSF